MIQDTVDLYLSTMGFNDIFNNRQSQAGAAHFPGPGLIDAIKSFKDPGKIIFRDADAGILDRNLDCGLRIAEIRLLDRVGDCFLVGIRNPKSNIRNHLCRQPYLPPFRRIFKGIIQDIEQGLFAVFRPESAIAGLFQIIMEVSF